MVKAIFDPYLIRLHPYYQGFGALPLYYKIVTLPPVRGTPVMFFVQMGHMSMM